MEDVTASCDLRSASAAGHSGSNSGRSVVETPAIIHEPQVTKDGVVRKNLQQITFGPVHVPI